MAVAATGTGPITPLHHSPAPFYPNPTHSIPNTCHRLRLVHNYTTRIFLILLFEFSLGVLIRCFQDSDLLPLMLISMFLVEKSLFYVPKVYTPSIRMQQV